jgi:hypothetical protein
VQHVELSLHDCIEQALIALHPIDCAPKLSGVIRVFKDALRLLRGALIDCPIAVTWVCDASQTFHFMKAAVGGR